MVCSMCGCIIYMSDYNIMRDLLIFYGAITEVLFVSRRPRVNKTLRSNRGRYTELHVTRVLGFCMYMKDEF